MSLFLLWGPPVMTGDGPKMVHLSPKLAKHGSLVNVPKWSKREKMDPFAPFQTKIDFLLRITSAQPYFVNLGQKSFLSKMSKRAQKGPKWLTKIRFAFGTLLDPFGMFKSLPCLAI